MGSGRPRWIVHHGHQSALDHQPLRLLLSGNLSELLHCRRCFWASLVSFCWRRIGFLQLKICFYYREYGFKVLQLIQAYISTAAMLCNDYCVSGLTLKCREQRSSPKTNDMARLIESWMWRLTDREVCVHMTIVYSLAVFKKIPVTVTDKVTAAYLIDACSVL